MKIEVGKRYLYKRNVETNGVNKAVEEVVVVKRICEHRAKVQIIGGKETTVDIRCLREFEVHFPKVEPQDEQPAEYPPGTKLTSNRLFTIDEPSKPAHYDTGIDTIAFLRANCPPEQVEGFLRGNAIKYLQRYAAKGTPIEDLKKSRHYIDMLIEELEGRE